MKRRRAAAAIAALLVAAVAPSARAEGLTADERARLEAGEAVTRPIDFERNGEPHFGGVAYAIIDAPADEVLRALLDAESWRAIFPLTMEAKELSRRGDDRRVYLRHGGRAGSAAWVAVVRRQSPTVVRFWLDPGEPHDVADCWGYFRAEPLGPSRTLFTYAAVLSLEFGVVRMFFTEKIRSYAMRTPLLMKHYVESRRPRPSPPPAAPAR